MLHEKSNFGHGANSGGMSTAQASIGGVTLYGTVDAGVGFKSLKKQGQWEQGRESRHVWRGMVE